MTRWSRWHPRAGSLQRFLLIWMLAGLWLTVAVITLWHVIETAARLAREQDARLVTALSDLPQIIARQRTLSLPDMLHAARAPPGGTGVGRTHYRLSAMNGDWLSGDQGLAPYPWRAALAAQGSPQLYITHVRGSLVRAAAAIREVPANGAPVSIIAQVAAPLGELIPYWNDLFTRALASVYAAAAVMSVIVWSGVSIAARWLDRARAALHVEEHGGAAYAGPSELQSAVQRMQQLHRSQREWIEQQRRFLADASHQLRTPMAVLRTQLQSAIAGDVPTAEMLPQMLHTVDRAAGLVHQLLSLTKLEQLKRSGDLPSVNLHLAARDAVMELSPLIAAKRLDFGLDGPQLQAPGDPMMLGELLRNLLANAIHHAPATGRLGILLRQCTGRIELVVWDEGPGVDDAVRARLFQPFSASKGGVGLGLSICKQIAEAMGATVDLHNRVDAGRIIGVDAVVAWGQGP